MEDSQRLSKANNVLPQVIAALVAGSFSISFGASVVQPAVTVAQLKKIYNFTYDDVITITDNDAFWITSIGNPAIIATTIILSFLADNLGRLNTMRLMVLPFLLGQFLMATSSNVEMLLAGRAISMGISISFPVVASVYIAEISSPSIRGTLLNIKSISISIGILLTYVKGKYLTWRTVAYILNVYVLISLGLSMFIPESTYWLALKRKTKETKKSAQWFGSLPPVVPNLPRGRWNCSAFLKPTFYRPMIFIIGFYFFQEMSGSNVILIQLITFFNDLGTNHNPYTISIYVGVAKVLIGLSSSWCLLKFDRRSLAIFSFLGMSIFICLSATFTLLLNNGNASLHWIPPVMLICYEISLNLGVMFLPYTVSSELWSGNIRATANSCSIGVGNLVIFLSIQIYYLMKKTWTSWSIQYFYAISAIGGSLYIYLFLPETRNKTLIEIEEYNRSYSNYISARIDRNKQKPLIQVHELSNL